MGSKRDLYDVVIGLEVHIQLSVVSKIFSGDQASYGAPPNTQASVITLGHPGTLPKLNRQVVQMGIKLALACHADISKTQHFDRKNYFYPDLPKGYQITQDRTPLCRNGYLTIHPRTGTINIPIEKIHMEEDAGKSIHTKNGTDTLLDFNRAGVPLLEMVTKPAIQSAEDAGAFLAEVRKLIRYLEISDGNMEEGSLRCDANVSVKPRGAPVLGTKVEIKNLNSIRNLSHAIEFDIDRQIQLAETGQRIVSETRTFDASVGKTFPMRTKEELNDYRYFPDPDLSPLHVSDVWIDEVQLTMPHLPQFYFEKFVGQYQLSPTDALLLTEEKETAAYFDDLCSRTGHYKAAANWMAGPVRSFVREKGKGMAQFPLVPSALSALVDYVEDGHISFSIAAQRIFPSMTQDPVKSPEQLIRELNLAPDRDVAALAKIVEEVIKEFPLKVEEFKNGKTGIVSMFMGEVMKRTEGKVDPRSASEMISRKLQEK